MSLPFWSDMPEREKDRKRRRGGGLGERGQQESKRIRKEGRMRQGDRRQGRARGRDGGSGGERGGARERGKTERVSE